MNSFQAPRIRTSETLMGSLCQEVDALRRRASHLQEAMPRCRNPLLFERLRRELANLQQRHRELHRAARSLAATAGRDSLAAAFLLELTRRPLAS
jgi:predicted  nucleic acid-binding Zn-ribbon protein